MPGMVPYSLVGINLIYFHYYTIITLMTHLSHFPKFSQLWHYYVTIMTLISWYRRRVSIMELSLSRPIQFGMLVYCCCCSPVLWRTLAPSPSDVPSTPLCHTPFHVIMSIKVNNGNKIGIIMHNVKQSVLGNRWQKIFYCTLSKLYYSIITLVIIVW